LIRQSGRPGANPGPTIATIQWHLLHHIMFTNVLASARVTFIGTLVLALGSISAAVVLPKVLEGQTRKQCITRDWSPEAHAVHMEFCKTYGYPTN
jgi:hypothetical protein